MTLLEKLLAKKKAERLTVKEIGNTLDIPIERINSWIKQKTNPKHEDSVKLEKWLNKPKKPIVNLVEEEPFIYAKTSQSDRLLDVIEKLTNTNAEQQKTISKLVDKLGNADAQTKAG